ncbi:MAG: endolytic transglycosylase MltG [Acidobacteriota bacterium]|nr:endolytic transglycosylase MltG [Acidobacteriota bacterium]
MKLLVAVICALAGLAVATVVTPYQGFQTETFVEIPRGTGTRAIAQELTKDGVIRYSWEFELLRLLQPSSKLQAGEYRFAKPASALAVFNRIARGDIYFVEFTVPEGSNIFDIAKSLEADGVMSAEDFLAAAEDPSLIRDLSPQAKTLEGYLFPSTYRLSHTATPARLTKIMTDEFRKQWSKLTATHPADARGAVTLASLVEKETASPAERPVVASVFRNRLAQGMRLQCDPTAIYAALLENRYRGTIHKSDLASANPYNTYENAGLPPGPIANPSAESLRAALEPADTPFLYFVAKPAGGGHQFSTTIAQHEKAVIAYRHATQRKIR